MKLSEELKLRGFIHQFTAETLEEIVDGEKRTIYHGIDPSGDSAHVGHMVNWMMLRHLHDAGHKILFLVGGGTGMIGDPKPDAERILQTADTINENVAKIKFQAERLIGGGGNIEFVNNADWLLKQNLIEFLRDIGKHFTVNELIKKDAIAKRLESETGISYTEFAYPLLQAFDYLQLHKNYNCDVQTGGSDQWGNIVAGVDLIRRKEQTTVYAVTTPLVVDKSSGKKFGKSEGNAIWLDPSKTSPYQFFQFWLNTSDESVVDYLKLFSILSLDEIAAIEQEWVMNPGARLAQRKLAEAVTSFVHGESITASVTKVSNLLFSEGSLSDLTAEERDLLLANAPHTEVTDGSELADILLQSELASSKREARTFIESGAVSINGVKIGEIDAVISADSFINGLALLKRGKKHVSVLVQK